MKKGIEYTFKMHNALVEYQNLHLISTIKELSQKAWLWNTAIFRFNKNRKISINAINKIKENLNIDLLKV